MVKRIDLIKAFASMVGEETLVITPIGSTTAYWDELGRGPTSLTSVSLGNVYSHGFGRGSCAAASQSGGARFRRQSDSKPLQPGNRCESKTSQSAYRRFRQRKLFVWRARWRPTGNAHSHGRCHEPRGCRQRMRY